MTTLQVPKRLLLIPLGILLGLICLEAGLQVAALAMRIMGDRMPTAWIGTSRRVLCLGDSNTYGLYLRDRALAYPQQLEKLWNESADGSRIEVLNLGYPGTNSSRLRRDLPRMLDTFRPDLLIVMIGSNDSWTAPVDPGEVDTRLGRVVRAVERWSRVYQLTYMLRRAFDQRRLEIVRPKEDGGSSGTARFGDAEFAMGWTKGGGQPNYDRHLAENLRAIANIAHGFGVELVFMTYPSRMWNYGGASRVLRTVVPDTGARLVDLAAVFDPECPKEPCPDWIYPDHHPTAPGYHLIAETLVRELRGTL